MYRINFLTFWIGTNAAYAILIDNFANNSNKLVINDGSWGFLEVFSAYLALLVSYRILFGGLHILNFKLKSWFKKYKVNKIDLH
jgi:hypothetical protein